MKKTFKNFSGDEARVGIQRVREEGINVTIDEQSLLAMANQIGARMTEERIPFLDARKKIFKALRIRNDTDVKKAYIFALATMFHQRELARIHSHVRGFLRKVLIPVPTYVDDKTGQVTMDF